MCHGLIDPKTLMAETEARYLAARPRAATDDTSDDPLSLPPELTGGLKGLWARLRARLPRRRAAIAAE